MSISGVFSFAVRRLQVLVLMFLSPTFLFAQVTKSNDTSVPNSQTSSTYDHGTQQDSVQPPICGLGHLDRCLKDIAHDQAGIWTSPFRLHFSDGVWLLPLAGATAAALHYDVQAQHQLGLTPSKIQTSSTIATFGAPQVVFGEGAALYVIGSLTHHEHLAETGRLGAEAVLDASIVTEALKLATNRERPFQGNGNGNFWPHGTRNYSLDSSFPSGHAAASWALARVIAQEYPNTWVRIGVYSFATAISVSRVTDGQHFPSDALVGSAIGYLIGGYVYRHRSSNSDDPTVSFVPLMDPSTQTYGLRINLIPQRQKRGGPSESDLAILTQPRNFK